MLENKKQQQQQQNTVCALQYVLFCFAILLPKLFSILIFLEQYLYNLNIINWIDAQANTPLSNAHLQIKWSHFILRSNSHY